MKAKQIAYGSRPGLSIFCPGCKEKHVVTVDAQGWQWNGSLELPTLSPSLLVSNHTGTLCHSFVRDGKIQFLTDSKHELAGQTVDLPDINAKGYPDEK